MSTLANIPVESDARTLREDVRRNAERSFAFFVRALLGLRRLSAERLDAVQGGTLPLRPQEEKLLEAWRAFLAGEVVPSTEWVS
jgi:hypothetical protein